jgi:hypothetical protein
MFLRNVGNHLDYTVSTQNVTVLIFTAMGILRLLRASLMHTCLHTLIRLINAYMFTYINQALSIAADMFVLRTGSVGCEVEM